MQWKFRFPGERRSQWPNRQRGRSSARSRCSPRSARGAARILPTAPGIATWPRAPRCGCCARSRPPASSAGRRRAARIGRELASSSSGRRRLSNESLIDLAKPTMEKLVAETGESAYLSVEGHGATALYIGIVEGTHSVRHTSWVGRTVPLDKSAAGRALRGRVPDVGYVVVERGVEADVTAIACPVYSQGANRRRDEPGHPELPAHAKARRPNSAGC